MSSIKQFHNNLYPLYPVFTEDYLANLVNCTTPYSITDVHTCVMVVQIVLHARIAVIHIQKLLTGNKYPSLPVIRIIMCIRIPFSSLIHLRLTAPIFIHYFMLSQ
ncbi:MAG: hypothetical protein IPJ66_15810 [Bacteroidetes bacterium]|nr:hypothetical protein [Bacteroidota bacterium]